MKRRFVESAGFSEDRKQLGQRALGRGKRGGVRVYYLDLPRRGVTHLVAIFGKREKSDLSPAERRVVAALVKQLKEETS